MEDKLPYTIPDIPVDGFTIKWFEVMQTAVGPPRAEIVEWEAEFAIGATVTTQTPNTTPIGVTKSILDIWVIRQRGCVTNSREGWDTPLKERWGEGCFSDVMEADRLVKKIQSQGPTRRIEQNC